MLNARRERGFNLIELMVALVVGMVISFAVITFIASLINSNNLTIQSTRVNQELRAVAEIVSRELRRARATADPLVDVGSGCVTTPTAPAVCAVSVAGAVPIPCPTCSPVTVRCCTSAGGGWRELTFNPIPTTAAPLASCVVFGYQNAGGGDFRAVRRLEASGLGSLVMVRQATAPTCATAGTTISSAIVNITAFELTPRDATGAVNVNGDRIDIRIAGRLAADPASVVREYRTSIFVRSGRS